MPEPSANRSIGHPDASDYGSPTETRHDQIRPLAQHAIPADWPQSPIALPSPEPSPSEPEPWPRKAQAWKGVPPPKLAPQSVGIPLVSAAPLAVPLMKRMGFRPVHEEGASTLMQPYGIGALLALQGLLSPQDLSSLNIHGEILEKEPGGTPLLFRAPKPPAGSKGLLQVLWTNVSNASRLYLMTAPKSWGPALRVAGWRQIPKLRIWATESLRSAAPFAAFASPLVAREMEKAGLPRILQREMCHIPSLFAWKRRWTVVINTEWKGGYTSPPRPWALSRSNGNSGWTTASPTAANRMRRYAPKSLKSFLEAQDEAGALRRVKPASLTLLMERREGTGGEAPKKKVYHVGICPQCGQTAALPGVTEKGQPCNREKCGFAPDEGIPASVRIPRDEMMRLRTRMSPRAWREFAHEIGKEEILARRIPTPLPKAEVAKLVSQIAVASRLGNPERQLTALQHKAVQWMLRNPVSLNATYMGGGKTPITLTMISVLLGSRPGDPQPPLPDMPPVLVIVPARLRLKWVSEAKLWLDPRIMCVAVRTRSHGIPKAGVVVASYETIRDRPDLQQAEWSIVVWEEGHYVKKPEAQRSKAVLRVKSPRTNMLTGTPIYNRPQDLQPILARACPQAYSDLARFRRAHRILDAEDKTADEERMLEELGILLRETIMWRPSKEESRKDMPKNPPPEVIEVEIGDADQIRKEQMALLEELRERKGGNVAVFAQLQKLMLETARRKLPAVHEQVQLCADTQAPALVFCRHVEICEAIHAKAEKAGIRAAIITGAVLIERRHEIIADFQAGRIDILVLTWGAGGEGLDMPRAEVVLFAELDWSPATMDQAEARAIRHGQTHPVQTTYMVAANTIDSHIAGTLAGKSQYQSEGLADASPQAILAGLSSEMEGVTE